MGKQHRTLDFSLLPNIDSMDIFLRLHRTVEERFRTLSWLQETHQRAHAALMFFFQADAEEQAWRNEARIRAGLNEFYAIEGAAVRDFRAQAISHAPPRIAESQNPLVHLMYTLRHVNVHTLPIRSQNKEVAVTSLIGGEHEFSYHAVVLAPFTPDDMYRVNEVKTLYSRDELHRAIAWLLQEQQTFGASEVFRAGVSAYCTEILDALPNATAS